MNASCCGLAALSLCACATSSPLAHVVPQVEIRANPGNVPDRPYFALSLTTWNDLDTLADGITSGAITATLNDHPLALDAAATGYAGEHDSYAATFALPAAASPLTSTSSAHVAITDGETTWSADVANLFANDLETEAPAAPGANTFAWPSAASSSPYSSIDWACVDVAGQPSACGGGDVADPAIAVSQGFITANLTGAPGSKVTVTAERRADRAASGDGPMFLVTIVDQLQTTL